MPQPFLSDYMTVRSEWIDYNGHLNMAFYNVLMNQGVGELWKELGFGDAYRKETGCTTFSAEYRMHYRREVREGDRLRATFQLLDFDAKRFHFAQELIHEEGWVSAQGEGLALHINQSGPHVAPMPAHILANLEALMAEHSQLERPAFVGRPMGIRHPR